MPIVYVTPTHNNEIYGWKDVMIVFGVSFVQWTMRVHCYLNFISCLFSLSSLYMIWMDIWMFLNFVSKTNKVIFPKMGKTTASASTDAYNLYYY
jgi:hypothetical protein